MIFEQLSSILVSHTVTIIVSEADGTTTLTLILKAKDEKRDKDHSIQIVGPYDEVETHLGDFIRDAVKKVTEFRTTLADLDTQLADAKKEKEALIKAEKAAAAAKKAPAKDTPADPDEDGEPAAGDKPPVVRRALPKAPPKAPSTSSGTLTSPAAAGLVPAVPPAPPASPVQQSLADLGL